MTTNIRVAAHCASNKEVVVELTSPRETLVLQGGFETEVVVYDDRTVTVRERLKGECGAKSGPFTYELGDRVCLSLSGEGGMVVSRSESLDLPSQYYVRYLTADARQAEGWFFASALAAQEG